MDTIDFEPCKNLQLLKFTCTLKTGHRLEKHSFVVEQEILFM